MLLNFSVTNYRSIKDEVTLSLTAGRERKNAERLTPIKALRKRSLPVSMIQGKNGAGKTNIIKGLQAAQRVIIRTRQPNEKLDVTPFRLCNKCLALPTEFSFDFSIGGTVYRYRLTLTRDAIQTEKLELLKFNSSATIFERNGQNIIVSGLTNDESERNDLRIIAQGTRTNQVFLNALAAQAENVDKYTWAKRVLQIFGWFANGINILSPDVNLTLGDSEQISFLTKALPLFDTGVNSVRLVELAKDSLNIPSGLIENILNMLSEGSVFPVMHKDQGPVFIKKIEGEARFFAVNTIHKNDTGEDVHFHMSDESDGTFRLMSLLTFLSLLGDGLGDRVLVIDEIERSLHSTLTRKIIKDFLMWVEQTHAGQIIFTSHDTSLMNDGLGLRRDEMWLVDKGENGETHLYSLASKNVRKSGEAGLRTGMNLADEYLSGSLGGIAKTEGTNFLMDR
ncbi:AAA family ATPase [Parasutterella secunda]|uniref:AAA family ATPase n=1 Tax=Parasutterella secunda TaxID=626947 RepID=UPI0025A45A89|nr:ATP-binding protein [Parasutterella secunda]MDM8226363.1 ATP-binding protein [Parasutterella secunda]